MKGEDMLRDSQSARERIDSAKKTNWAAKAENPSIATSTARIRTARCALSSSLPVAAAPRTCITNRTSGFTYWRAISSLTLAANNSGLGRANPFSSRANAAHLWPRLVSKKRGRILDVFQLAGNIEEFFHK